MHVCWKCNTLKEKTKWKVREERNVKKQPKPNSRFHLLLKQIQKMGVQSEKHLEEQCVEKQGKLNCVLEARQKHINNRNDELQLQL